MDLPMFELTGKVAVVTGSGRGLGRAIALMLARAGADIVVTARSEGEIERTAEEIRKLGRKALAVTVDVRDPDRIAGLLEKTLAEFGKVDILVNNAGGESGGFGNIIELSPESWRDGIDMNLNSLFYCSRIIGGQMARQESGVIINITSGMGFGAFPGASHHAAARAGVMNFTKSLAVEMAEYGVRANAIAPGYTESPLLEKAFAEHPEERASVLKNIPLGRLARPEEVATVALFLASPASSYITGETIYISGGMITSVPPRWIEGHKPPGVK